MRNDSPAECLYLESLSKHWNVSPYPFLCTGNNVPFQTEALFLIFISLNHQSKEGNAERDNQVSAQVCT